MGTATVNFTKATIDRLTCPEGKRHVYFRDAKRTGLVLLVTRTGVRTFYLHKKIDGRSERFKLGRYPEVTPDKAREMFDRRAGEIADGKNPAKQRRAARDAIRTEATLADLLGHYLTTYAKSHKRTWEDDEAQFERYFGAAPEDRKPGDKPAPFPGWRNRPVSAITFSDVRSLHVKVGADHGPYAANRLLALLSKLFNHARLQSNPTKGIRRFMEQSRERFLQPDEMPQFFAALDAEDDPMIADFFRMLLFTGARRSNVQSMRWEHVNLGRRTWTIAADQTKAKRPIEVYLSDSAMEVLQRRIEARVVDHPERRQFVFPSYGASGHLQEPKMAWKRITERAGIEGLRIHDLRRSFGSWLAASGVSLPVIGKALGHQDGSPATKIYARLNLSSVREAVDLATPKIVAASKPEATPAPAAKTA